MAASDTLDSDDGNPMSEAAVETAFDYASLSNWRGPNYLQSSGSYVTGKLRILL